MIIVDKIKVSQFLIYLLLNNRRFNGGRIPVLERLQEKLRKRDFLPMVFNFDKPEMKDFTETARLLARLSTS